MKNLDLREAPMVIYQVENLQVHQWEILLLSYDHILICQA